MKSFETVLTKSYIVRIKAKNKYDANEFSTFFTSDIRDLSTNIDREKFNFEIEDIDCKINEVFEIKEVNAEN